MPKPKLQEFDAKTGKWKNINMVKQEPGGPYDQLHNFSKNVPPLINFDEYNPTKNKATIDAFKTWIDKAVYAAHISAYVGDPGLIPSNGVF